MPSPAGILIPTQYGSQPRGCLPVCPSVCQVLRSIGWRGRGGKGRSVRQAELQCVGQDRWHIRRLGVACCCCPTGRMIGSIRWETGSEGRKPTWGAWDPPSPPQTTRRRSVSEHPVWTLGFRPLASMRSYRTQKQHNASPVALSSHATPQNGRESTIIGGLSEPQLNYPTTPLGPEVFVRKTRACLERTNHMYSRSWRSRFKKEPAALFAPPTPASPISLPNLDRSSSVTLLFQFTKPFCPSRQGPFSK